MRYYLARANRTADGTIRSHDTHWTDSARLAAAWTEHCGYVRIGLKQFEQLGGSAPPMQPSEPPRMVSSVDWLEIEPMIRPLLAADGGDA